MICILLTYLLSSSLVDQDYLSEQVVIFLLFAVFVFGVIIYACYFYDGPTHYTGGSDYSSYDSQMPRRNTRNSFRRHREDKQQSDQDGYRRGMEDAIFGDSYHYIRGVKGSDSYRNGYIRGYEENCWDDED